MTSYNQGDLGAAAAGNEEVPHALSSSLLPAAGNTASRGWAVGDHNLWYVPLKPLSQVITQGKTLFLIQGSWAGLQPGGSQQVVATVLVPCGLQEEEGVVPTGVDMPGTWRQVASTGCNMTSGSSRGEVKLNSCSLVQQLKQLAGDHYLLRAHYHQVGGITLIDIGLV
jgi:hypothetical protein